MSTCSVVVAQPLPPMTQDRQQLKILIDRRRVDLASSA